MWDVSLLDLLLDFDAALDWPLDDPLLADHEPPEPTDAPTVGSTARRSLEGSSDLRRLLSWTTTTTTTATTTPRT